MPKSPTKKQTRKAAAQDIDENTNLINTVRRKLDQQTKKSAGHSTQSQSRKNALYASARKVTQEFVKSSTGALENVQSTLLEMRAQEIPFQKYRDDFSVVIDSNQRSLEKTSALYIPVWKTLGQRRSEILEVASTMLVNNAPRRHDILADISRKARQQLEHVRQQEKDAEDAEKLIAHLKHVLRS